MLTKLPALLLLAFAAFAQPTPVTRGDVLLYDPADAVLAAGTGISLTVTAGPPQITTITNTGVLSLNGIAGLVTLQGTVNQVSVSQVGQSITIALPQNIATFSAPVFGGLIIDGSIAAQAINLISLTGTSPLVVTAAPAQAVSLSVWQDSGSNVIGSIGSLGTATFPGYVATNTAGTNTFQNAGGTPSFSVNGTGNMVVNRILIRTITGFNQCLQADSTGLVSGTGSACGSGGGGGSVAGPNLAIQYNNSGVVGGTANVLADANGNISVAGSGSVIAINGATGGLNITTDTNGASIQSVGGINLNLGSPSTVGITITAATSPTVDMTDWKNNSGSVLDAIEPSGTLKLGTITGATQCLQVNTLGEVAGTGAICGSGGGGSAVGPLDAIQFTNGSGSFQGTGNALVDANGNISIAGTGSVISIQGTNGGITITGTNGQINSISNTDNAAIQTVGGFTAVIGNATTTGLTIKSNASQSAYLSQWEKSDGTVVGYIGNLGTPTFPGYVATNTGIVNTFQNSGGSPTFAVNGNGLLTTTNLTIASITGLAQCLQISSAGVVSGSGGTCGTGGGGTPVGPTGAIQFNNAGGFGGTGNALVDANGNISIAGSGSVISVQGPAGGVNITGSTNGATFQSTGGIQSRGGYIQQTSTGGPIGGYYDFTPVTYNPYDSGTVCHDQWGNIVTQPLPLTGASFGSNDTVMWVSTSPSMPSSGACGAAIPVNITYGLNINSYFFARGGLATDQTSFNSIQSLLGGIYARTTMAIDQFPTMEFHATTASLYTPSHACVISSDPSPGSGDCYGALAYQSGSTYWYWNGATHAWGTVNFAALGGITSINSQVGPAVTIVSGGTGITVNTGTNSISIVNSGVTSLGGATGGLFLGSGAGISISGLTVSNTGVTFLSGTGNQVNVSASTGNITLSLPQNICTGCGVTFNGVTSSNFINVTGGGYQVAGTTVIDGSRNLNSIASLTTTGNVTTTAQYQISNVTVIDSSRDLTNINTISAAGGSFSVGSLGTTTAPGFNMNSTGGYFAAGLAGVNSSTCSRFTYGICTAP